MLIIYITHLLTTPLWSIPAVQNKVFWGIWPAENGQRVPFVITIMGRKPPPNRHLKGRSEMSVNPTNLISDHPATCQCQCQLKSKQFHPAPRFSLRTPHQILPGLCYCLTSFFSSFLKLLRPRSHVRIVLGRPKAWLADRITLRNLVLLNSVDQILTMLTHLIERSGRALVDPWMTARGQ